MISHLKGNCAPRPHPGSKVNVNSNSPATVTDAEGLSFQLILVLLLCLQSAPFQGIEGHHEGSHYISVLPANALFYSLSLTADHLWLFDKLTIASWSPVATITDERGTINLETNVLQKTGSNDKDYRIDNFELSNGVEWIKSKDSLHGDCLTSPKHCKDGMSLSFWLSSM